jgi:uncharacterized iron-regulated membrane protein
VLPPLDRPSYAQLLYFLQQNGAIDFGWDTFDAETKLKKRAIELNQGRAAMMGILALMVHEKLGVSILP